MRKIASLPVGFLVLLLSLGLLSFLPDAAAGADDGCKNASIMALGATPIQGDAFLCIDPQGVHVSLHAKALTPGYAYTMWFFYFNDPSQCVTPGQCGALADVTAPGQCEGPLDLKDFNPVGVVGRLDSAVAPENGNLDFSGRVRGLHLSSGSQVFIVIAEHGPANASDNRALARQLLTPEDPFIGAPQLGNCVDGPRTLVGGAIVTFNIL
jgi:hypothetical protein